MIFRTLLATGDADCALIRSIWFSAVKRWFCASRAAIFAAIELDVEDHSDNNTQQPNASISDVLNLPFVITVQELSSGLFSYWGGFEREIKSGESLSGP